MNVKEIVLQYLKDNGFDGLYYDDSCGCKIEWLMPCSCDKDECRPGHLMTDTETGFNYIGEKKV